MYIQTSKLGYMFINDHYLNPLLDKLSKATKSNSTGLNIKE